MNHDYLVLGRRYVYIYIHMYIYIYIYLFIFIIYIHTYMLCICVRGKFARASICMKAPLPVGQHVSRRMSLVFCTGYMNIVTYIVLCSHCMFCSLGVAVVTYT